jgi:hypothetical protein
MIEDEAARKTFERELKAIITAVGVLRAQLDPSATRCESCGHTHNRNWPEKQLDNNLSGAEGRLIRSLRTIRDEYEGAIPAAFDRDEG